MEPLPAETEQATFAVEARCVDGTQLCSHRLMSATLVTACCGIIVGFDWASVLAFMEVPYSSIQRRFECTIRLFTIHARIAEDTARCQRVAWICMGANEALSTHMPLSVT